MEGLSEKYGVELELTGTGDWGHWDGGRQAGDRDGNWEERGRRSTWGHWEWWGKLVGVEMGGNRDSSGVLGGLGHQEGGRGEGLAPP